MERRTLLGGIGLTLGTGLAGCTGLGTAAEDDTPTDSPGSATPTGQAGSDSGEGTDRNGGDASDSQPADGPTRVSETVVVPWQETPEEDVQPHDLRLWNAVERDRTVTATVRPPDSVLTTLTTSHTVPAGEAVAIELRQPATYAVSVDVDGQHVTSFEIGESWFDCNSSVTTVELGADGATDRTDFSTLLACTDSTVSEDE